jgi:hypothetical protein
METCSHEIAFEWIRSGRDDQPFGRDDPRWVGNFVSHLLPKTFATYAKVFHQIDVYYDNIDNPLSPKELEILRIPPCVELKSLIEKLRANCRGTRLRWKEIAEFLQVPFQPELNHEWYRAKLEAGCWPRFLKGPDEGTLNHEECSALVSVLLPFTGNQRCFFRFAEMPFVGTDKPLMFQGSLEEVKTFPGDEAYRFTPEYWWPADQSWCVCSDYDLMFTFVGGSKDLISRLSENEVLECIEVTLSTRIDSHAVMN